MARIDLELGKRIKALRKKLGDKNQADFGARFGVEQATVSRWENKGAIPAQRYWDQIADLAGQPKGEFFFGVEPDDEPLRPQHVPVVSRIAAGKFVENEFVLDESMVHRWVDEMLPDSRWMAFQVEGDSMNRVAPDGSLVFVNCGATDLENGYLYALMTEDGEATFKKFRVGPKRLEPMSFNDEHEIIFFERPTVLNVIGRAERVVVELI